MALRNTRRDFAPIVLVFVMITALAIVFRSRSVAWNLDSDVVIFGNLFLFLVTLFSFFYCQKGVAGQKPACFHAFSIRQHHDQNVSDHHCRVYLHSRLREATEQTGFVYLYGALPGIYFPGSLDLNPHPASQTE